MGRLFSQERLEDINGWAVWRIYGRLDRQTCEEACEMGEEIMSRTDKLVLDMSHVDYLSSAGLRVLLRLIKLSRKDDKKFTVAAPSNLVKSVLDDSGMNSMLNTRASLEDLKKEK